MLGTLGTYQFSTRFILYPPLEKIKFKFIGRITLETDANKSTTSLSGYGTLPYCYYVA